MLMRPTLLWLPGLTCNGNTQSFLCAEEELLNVFFEEFEILFHPSLSVDEELDEVVNDVLSGKKELNFLVLEGAIPLTEGIIYKINEKPFYEIVRELANLSDFVVALGNCAVYGNIPALKDEKIVGLQFRFKEKEGLLGKDFRSKRGLPVVNISGCPAHPEWFINTLLELKRREKVPLDELGRPKEFYAYFTHDGCIRVQYYEWKVEAEELGTKEGCLFYKFGCRGPLTHSSCNRILWNGVSSKTRSGQPCFGCTEFDFPRENLFETKLNMGIPAELPPEVSLRAYIMMAGVAKTFTPKRLKRKLIDEDNEEAPNGT